MKKNIIIVDDHKMFLEGLSSILDTEDDYQVILATDNAKNAVKYLEVNATEKVDLIITDIGMPDMNGIAFNAHVKKQYPSIRTLIVSTHKESKMYHLLKDQGADGYIPKNAEKKELLKAIKSIMKGKKYFSESIERIYITPKEPGLDEIRDSLTNRERDILCLIAKEYTTQAIGDKLCLSKHTIESYRKTLMTKLGASNVAGLAVWCIKLELQDHC